MNCVSSSLLLEMPRLTVERLSLTEWHSKPMHTLGALRYGHLPASAAHGPSNDPVTDIAGQMLLDGEAQLDIWRSSAPVEPGRSGQVRWWRHAEWLFGSVDLDEGTEPEGLTDISRKAYLDIFRSLGDSHCPHLLRVWNYLPRINVDGGGLERYRQFNAGRQQAFLQAQRAAFDGAPAACALGTSAGPLSVRFLAGRHAPTAIENPRQVSAYRYPTTYGPRAPTFSRAALSDMGNNHLALFISGTASIVGHESMHPGDVMAQTHEILRNLQAVINSAHTRCNAGFDIRQLDCVVYVRHPADAPQVRDILSQTLGVAAHSVRKAVYLQADICRSDLLVEIEAHSVAVGTVHS